MFNKSKKLFCMALLGVMMIGSVPITARADTPEENAIEGVITPRATSYTFKISNGTITIASTVYVGYRHINRGDTVTFVQVALNYLGYNCGSMDGIYGTNTSNGIKAFQRACGLTADGTVGPKTWAALRDKLAGRTVPINLF